VSHAGCDQIGGLPQINMAGSLQVVQTGPLLGGETFKLFDAASYTGDFYEPYALPDLTGLPLSWDPSSVPTTGILRLSGTLVPIVQSATSSGPGNFQLSGIGPTNWNYSVVATTNITQPLSNWVQVASGTFVSGTFTFSDPHAGLYPRRFYQVVTQSP
jgi:hypothetical protein